MPNCHNNHISSQLTDFGAGERGREDDVPGDVAVSAGAAEGAGQARLEGTPAPQGREHSHVTSAIL